MTALERVERTKHALKVFPLPSVVLFPHTLLPLHIFEPRYRDLVRDALAQDRVMALAQLEPGYEGSYAGRPRMRPMVCAGLIAWHEQLEGGQFNIIVQGTVRARILDELAPRTLYREVDVSLLPDEQRDFAEEEPLRQAVFELAARLPPSVAQGLLEVAARSTGGALADVVASSVVADVERRQELLCELQVGPRLRAVLAEVGEVLARLQPARPEGPVN
ncbi:MAG TPA: LON peptidase substrate-binding domain-containing protein [Myxococcaceae bacterium]|nr:LON peptidase substrate-binding domain-containing protein [Myxococcaceae bacterium]